MSSKKRASSWAKPPPPNMSVMGRANDMFWLLADPWVFMAASVSYLPGTIVHLVNTGNFSALFSWESLQTKWFGRFWAWAGPMVRSTGEARVVPLLEGRVSEGEIRDAPVKPGVHGVVVEVGAGSGMWIELFKNDYHGKHSMEDTAVASGLLDASAYELPTRRSAAGETLGRSRVTKVYGVEPNPQSHEALTQRVKDTGLDDIYEVVPVGIEHIGGGHWKWEKKIEKESVDCVVSVLCLCSIPDPEDNVRDLYQYLKPGGHWYVYEHVGCTKKVSQGMVLYQRFINIFWRHVMGGCQINRDTEKTLRDAGTWTDIDLERPRGEAWYHPVPHLYGVLTK